MTDIEIQALREKAEAATPGPWVAGECGGWLVMAGPLIENRPGYLKGGRGQIAEMDDDAMDEDAQAANAEFIAAVHPGTVITLLDALASAREEGRREGFEKAREMAAEESARWSHTLRDAIRAMRDEAGEG